MRVVAVSTLTPAQACLRALAAALRANEPGIGSSTVLEVSQYAL